VRAKRVKRVSQEAKEIVAEMAEGSEVMTDQLDLLVPRDKKVNPAHVVEMDLGDSKETREEPALLELWENVVQLDPLELLEKKVTGAREVLMVAMEKMDKTDLLEKREIEPKRDKLDQGERLERKERRVNLALGIEDLKERPD